VLTFDAASIRGSRLSESRFADMTTDAPIVTAVMATAAIPKATCGIEVSYRFIVISSLLYRWKRSSCLTTRASLQIVPDASAHLN
jgi:hypothetical protein